MIADPRPHLDALGIPWVNVTDPYYGYDGTFLPEAVMLHHTASAAGSNTCADVLWGRHYHACVGRDGMVYLGGHEVRQGHGGEGRRSPLEVARAGRMSYDAITLWQNDSAGDDTSTMANERTLAVCIDNDGQGEAPSPEQYTAFVACAAAFLHALGRSGGHLLDHASSTNRKVDLIGTCLELDPSCWFDDIGVQVDRLAGPSTPRRNHRMWRTLHDDSDQYWAADGMHVRWLPIPWSLEDYRDQLTAEGYSTELLEVSREGVDQHHYGVVVGGRPPW